MTINFGDLDYVGTAPAKELKTKMQTIAFGLIQEMLLNWSRDEKGATSFIDEVDGVVSMVEAISDQIDSEVAHKEAEMLKYSGKAGETYGGT